MPGSKGRRPGLLIFGKQSKTQRVKVSHFRLVFGLYAYSQKKFAATSIVAIRYYTQEDYTQQNLQQKLIESIYTRILCVNFSLQGQDINHRKI